MSFGGRTIYPNLTPKKKVKGGSRIKLVQKGNGGTSCEDTTKVETQ